MNRELEVPEGVASKDASDSYNETKVHAVSGFRSKIN